MGAYLCKKQTNVYNRLNSIPQLYPHNQEDSLGFGPEFDLDRSVGCCEPDGANMETSCHGRMDARRIMVKREVVGAGMSKSSSREV
ncbi:MAG: hypothetical protein Q9176_003787 [Flavoplaca citrina]